MLTTRVRAAKCVQLFQSVGATLLLKIHNSDLKLWRPPWAYQWILYDSFPHISLKAKNPTVTLAHAVWGEYKGGHTTPTSQSSYGKKSQTSIHSVVILDIRRYQQVKSLLNLTGVKYKKVRALGGFIVPDFKPAVSVTQFLAETPSALFSFSVPHHMAARLCGSRARGQPRKPLSAYRFTKQLHGHLPDPNTSPLAVHFSWCDARGGILKVIVSPQRFLQKTTSVHRQDCCLVTWLCTRAVKQRGPTWRPLHFPHRLCNQEGAM